MGAIEARPASEPSRPRRQPGTREVGIGLAILGAVGTFLGLLWWYQTVPGVSVPRLAKAYLSALNTGNYQAAYDLLSKGSRANCSLQDFVANRSPIPWRYSDVRTTLQEEDAIWIRYVLLEQGRPPQDDYLLFVREEGRWVRPYIRNLFDKVEDAFDRNDPEKMLLYAQTMVQINPKDPIARGYLCEAAYYRKDPAAAERECREAIRMSQAYPSGLNPQSLYHLHAILGDTYKNSLQKYDEALREYDLMLSFPNPSSADQCTLGLAKADVLLLKGIYAQGHESIREAGRHCLAPEDLAYAQKALRMLEGRAGKEAEALVRRYRQRREEEPLLQFEGQRSQSSRIEGSRGDETATWSSEHVEGPVYRVRVLVTGKGRAKGPVVPLVESALYKVNLWTGTILNGEGRARVP